jgi:hypothetical protein
LAAKIGSDDPRENRVPPGEPARRKAVYRSPRLVCYGSVAKLTQGSGGTTGDSNKAMAMCL